MNGLQEFITHAIHADTCVAVAVTDRATRSKGISRSSLRRECRLLALKKENKLGLRASETASVVLDCYVPDENRLGEVDRVL